MELESKLQLEDIINSIASKSYDIISRLPLLMNILSLYTPFKIPPNLSLIPLFSGLYHQSSGMPTGSCHQKIILVCQTGC